MASSIGTVRTCEECGREYVYSRNGATLKSCNSCRLKVRRARVRDMIFTLVEPRCSRCGYDRSTAALHFHHRRPGDKKFGIADAYCRSLAAIKAELAKCDIVCANCHAELHYEEV